MPGILSSGPGPVAFQKDPLEVTSIWGLAMQLGVILLVMVVMVMMNMYIYIYIYIYAKIHNCLCIYIYPV